MKVFLLLLLIGTTALAFTPGMEYKYQYEGTLKLGIPEIRNKFSSVGIKATVTVQVQTPEKTVIKMSDIKFGEYVGDAGLKMLNPVPLVYFPLREQAEALEKPFEVFLQKNLHEVMVVPESDLEWVVNLRKSIAQLFLVEPIRGHVDLIEKKLISKSFTTEEPTLFGTCSVDYVISSIPEREIPDTYLMTRTINFDKCDDEVVLMKTSFSPLIDISKGYFGNVASRSSVMTLKLVGYPGKIAIQEGNVQGYFAVNPFGSPSDKLTSFTNQTYLLKSTTQITKDLIVPKPTRFVKTWFMEVGSPFTVPQNPTPFINYYGKRDATYAPLLLANSITGIPLNPNFIKQFQTTLDKLIGEIASLMFDVGPAPKGKITPESTNEGKITSMLDTASYVVRGIDVQELEQIFDNYFNDNTKLGQMKLKILIDVLAASDLMAPMKVLLNEMKKGRITPERITSFFVTFSNNFVGTPLLPDVLEFVKSLNMDTNPIMTTNVWINFASALNRICITKKASLYQMYGKEACNVEIITNDFIPFLKRKFATTNESFKRCAIIQTLSNLGTPEAIEFISTVVNGDFDVRVREIAILAFNFPKTRAIMKKDDTFNVLMPIVHNRMEEPILRQNAIAVLLSWKPSPSWWYRLAVSTWREPSTSVASFIYSLIKGNFYNTDPIYRQASKIAHFLLPLTKPMPPSSSLNFLYAKTNPQEYSTLFFLQSLLKDDTSSFPRDIYTLLMTDFGGIRIPFLETLFSTAMVRDTSATMAEEIFQRLPEELMKIIRTAPNRRAEEILDEIKKQLNPSFQKEKTFHKESSLFVKLFENLQFLLPLNPKTVPLPFDTESFNSMKALMNGEKLELSKFFNPNRVEIFLPTELGIPFVGKMSTPTVQSAEGTMKFAFEGKNSPSIFDLVSAKSFAVHIKTNYKFATKVITNFEVILPWNQKRITSGVETLKSLNLPMQLKTAFETQGTMLNISFDIIPTYEKEFASVVLQNIPYVARKSMWPGELVSEFEVFEPITVTGSDFGIYQNEVVIDKEFYGLDGVVSWKGDIPYPFTSGNFLDIIENPYKLVNKMVSPSAKLFTSAVILNFGKSETKAFHPSIAFNLPFINEDKMMKKTEDTDSMKLIIRILMTGTQDRFFESNYHSKILARDTAVQRSEINYQHIQRLPGDKSQVYCVQIETSQPRFTYFQTLLKQLEAQNVDYSFSGKVRGGTSCKDLQFATLKGSLTLSKPKRESLKNMITKELDINKNSMVEMEDEPFYDRISIFIDYKEPLPVFFTNMTYQAYNILYSSQFPYVSSNFLNVKNPKGKITIEGKRLTDGAWNLRTELPTENINMEHFQLPIFYKLPSIFFPSVHPDNKEYEVKNLDNQVFF